MDAMESRFTRESVPHRSMDLRAAAHIEVSSEDELFPIELAFVEGPSLGWRAAHPGPQVIRLVFHQPQSVQHISLRVIERASERTQEIILRAQCTGDVLREFRRQEFNFSPAGSTEEVEEFAVELVGLQVIEIAIDPDRANAGVKRDVYATLSSMQLFGDGESPSS